MAAHEIEKNVAMTENNDLVAIPRQEYTHLKRQMESLALVKAIFQRILNNSSNGRKMFNIVTKTWNPVTGCLHQCDYCWARELANTKLKNSHRYRAGFKPTLNEAEFNTKFKQDTLVFVSDMGDLFGEFVPQEWILRVLEHIRHFPNTYFLFLTKNPTRYEEFTNEMPENAILGATIETNKDELFLAGKISSAPLPSIRYRAMKELNWDKKFVSIEPILDFDLESFGQWIREIMPFMVYVGYDNYYHKLPEPPLSKTLKLLDAVSRMSLAIKKTVGPAWFESVERHLGECNEQRKRP